jgi:HK97 family phage major capsid protein
VKTPSVKNMLLPPLLALALNARVAFAGPTPIAPPPAQESDSLEELQAKMVELHEQQEAIRATADKEHRRINDDEVKQLENLGDQFDALDDEVKARQRLLAQKEKLATPAPRKVPPADLPPESGRQRVTGGELVGASKNSWGFRSIGEFSKAVVAARSGELDPRIKSAATTYGNDTVLGDGGYLVPPDFRENIVKTIQGEDSLLGRTDQQSTSSDRITVPVDNTSPWQNTGGIQVYWDVEAAAITASKSALEQMEVKANRMTALVPVTNEQLEDAPSLSRYLPGKVADKYTSKINAAIISGDGVGKPQGLLKSSSKVAVAAEGGQASGTINYTNVAKMWARIYAPLRAGAIWLINQDIEPQLYSMVVPGTQPSYPAYMPPGGLSGAPYATLMGRPVIAQEFCETIGTEGDIILTNLSAYCTVQKVGGIRSDVSMHLYFDQNITAFRFVMRLGGQSWWRTAVSRAKGTNTLSNIVTLATR